MELDWLTFCQNFIWAILVGIYRFFIPKPMKSVKGETVMITGTGHGMGRELAFQYAAMGAMVACVDINETENKKTVDAITKLGNKAFAYTCDVTERSAVNETVDKILNEVGDVTILINNAGILKARPFLDQTEDDIKNTVNVNIMAHFWTLQAILPVMVRNNYGHVVALSSGCGLCGTVNLVPYCASKFAVRGMMDALLREFHRYSYHIKFTTIYPMIVDTGLCKRFSFRSSLLTPLVRPADAADRIIKAQRSDMEEASIPAHPYYMITYPKFLPSKAYSLVMDFFGVTIE